MLHLREADARLNGRTGRRWRLGRARLTIIFAVVLCSTLTGAAQTRRPNNRPPAPAAARHPPFKAVFEPVHYPGDVRITALFFASAEIGWACGDDGTGGGVIAATRDGGRTWVVQFGGAGTRTPALTQLSFADATHGWAAAADGTLLRTTDGSTWSLEGHVPAGRPIAFVSPLAGVVLDTETVRRTADGGRTWRAVHQCRVGSAADGMPRDRSCEPRALAFAPDRTTGYVFAAVPDGGASAIIKTSDGGATWATVWVGDAQGPDATLAFSDALTGFLRTRDDLRMTTDGGRTWHVTSAPLTGSPTLSVAGSTAWMVRREEFRYTFDGGKRWISRAVAFPNDVLTFTVVDDETGYVAGMHGMIYRFRIVPFEYNAAGMLAVAGMTTFAPR